MATPGACAAQSWANLFNDVAYFNRRVRKGSRERREKQFDSALSAFFSAYSAVKDVCVKQTIKMKDQPVQSPIFTKTSDFILWLLQHTEKFPKSERFRLAKRMEDSAFNFYEALIRAVKSSNKRSVLMEADLELDKLRLYVRLAHARQLTSREQYGYAANVLTEIGKLLGGWIKVLTD